MFPLLFLFVVLPTIISPLLITKPGCKCGPNDACWPSTADWNSLNKSGSGSLIADSPIAASCYPGPLQDNKTCAYVDAHWASQSFQASNPIGLSYPDDSCLPVNISAGQKSGKCSIGTSPRYTVNATTAAQISATINFAREKNIRLVIKNTGHDILSRSTGYGSLSVWISYLRNEVQFQEVYNQGSCAESSWKGSAFTIGGGYTWDYVYKMAMERNVLVVGGGTPSVGCLGGWAQGGGHGPAAHDYGLGADQILSAVVVLASGAVVTASPCSHSDLFFAIRGGGGGTYGVVIQTTIKAYPVPSMSAIQLSIAPKSKDDVVNFAEALADVYSYYPQLGDHGFSGYGSWSISSTTPVIENYTGPYDVAGFTQIYAIMNTNISTAQTYLSPLLDKLQGSYNSSAVYINTKFYSFDTYWKYWDTLSNISSPVGQSAALGSRLLDGPALTNNASALLSAIKTTAGTMEEYTSTNIVFVGGGAIASLNDPNSGVNPAWRKSYVHNIVARGWSPGTDPSIQQSIHEDITNVKIAALKKLAPDTGAYMNEADVQDPDYLADFYGQNLAKLELVKSIYDPTDLFYCPTCVGSERWDEDNTGRLCRRQSKHQT